MRKKSASTAASPRINLSGFQDRVLLEAEFITRNNELRNFSAIRDRLTAFGADANKAYRDIIGRRDKAAAKLREIRRPPAEKPRLVPPRRNVPLFHAPVAPANFPLPGGGGLGLGYSGFVQAGPLSEGVNVVPGGGNSGTIVTTNIGTPTSAFFSGEPSAALVPGSNDPTAEHFWLHTWQVLVPFPAPSTLSQLTYQFEVSVLFNVFGGGAGIVLGFVSVGETADLTGPVAITDFAGWPLIWDLSQPSYYYNGSYGSIQGQTTVQRSFTVDSVSIPAVAIAVGAVVGLPMAASVTLTFESDSAIGIGGTAPPGVDPGGRIAYYVQPELVTQGA